MQIKKMKGFSNQYNIQLTLGKMMAIRNGLKALGEGKDTKLNTLQWEAYHQLNEFIEAEEKKQANG